MPKTTLIAHRGGLSAHVENTLGAFRHAISAGFDGIEMDVRLTKDGIPVIHHNATLDPAHTVTMEGTQISPHAPPTIESLTYSDLSAYRLIKPESDCSDYIPSLKEAVAFISSLSGSCLMLVEIKASLSSPEAQSWQSAVDAVLAVLLPARLPNPQAVCSFHWDALADVNRRRPDLPTWFTTHRLSKTGAYWQTMRKHYRLEGVAGDANPDCQASVTEIASRISEMGGQRWLMHHSDYDSETLQACKSANLSPAAWAAARITSEERTRLDALGEGALCLDEL
jgi:glycerophosphoryl diester phosphodiesterase